MTNKMETEIERITKETNIGDIVELVLKENQFLMFGLRGDFGLKIGEEFPEHRRGLVTSLAGYFGGWQKYDGVNGVYIDPFISPRQETQWNQPTPQPGHLIEVPFSSIASYKILRRKEDA